MKYKQKNLLNYLNTLYKECVVFLKGMTGLKELINKNNSLIKNMEFKYLTRVNILMEIA